MIQIPVLGMMSGTSLDGVDLALCLFSKKEKKWNYQIVKQKVIPYSSLQLKQFAQIDSLSGEQLSILDIELGKWYGKIAAEFIQNEQVSLIASHGHTIYHQPEIRFTKQIGSGAAIYAATNIPTVCDFRSVDVLLNGQGAPLVPIGDCELFSECDYRINLGGIANCSYEEGNVTKAFDICPVNQVFNEIAKRKGLVFDKDGKIARSGKLLPNLFKDLNQLEYYTQPAPKSLGREWVEKMIFPLIGSYSLENFQHTFAHHVAYQITSVMTPNTKALFTGGGAYNHFLMGLIKAYSKGVKFEIPSKTLIEYKEALIFAFLGLLGAKGEINSLASVTGASRDSISCCVYGKNPFI